MNGPLTALALRYTGATGRCRLDKFLRRRIRGCLLGGALGDALGAPVEFLRLTEIQQRFGPDGIADYAPAYGRRGAITDDTQMTLFTAEGLLRGFVRESLKGICSVPSVVSHAYLRWLLTQGVPAAGDLEVGTDGWLWEVRDLHNRRAPGNTCISALAGMRHFTSERAPNSSKGAGAIMRIAPVGLVIGRSDEHAAPRAFELAKQISWVTHGHPSGYLPAASFAVMIHALLLGHTLEEGIRRGRGLLEREPDSAETIHAIDQALTLVRAGVPPGEAIPSIGGAWVGEEALGIAIYCASVAPNFESAVRMAVNHEGDSDTTGALVGQLLGTLHGENVLPERWLLELELRETITKLADDVSAFPAWDPHSDDQSADVIWKRYPGW